MLRLFDHVEFSVGSFQESLKFYSSSLPKLGYKVRFVDEKHSEAGFGAGETTAFLLYGRGNVRPFMHLAFKASNVGQVNEFYKAAISNGGKCNGRPGYREGYGSGYYAAFVIDPDGHNIEALYRDPNK